MGEGTALVAERLRPCAGCGFALVLARCIAPTAHPPPSHALASGAVLSPAPPGAAARFESEAPPREARTDWKVELINNVPDTIKDQVRCACCRRILRPDWWWHVSVATRGSARAAVYPPSHLRAPARRCSHTRVDPCVAFCPPGAAADGRGRPAAAQEPAGAGDGPRQARRARCAISAAGQPAGRLPACRLRAADAARSVCNVASPCQAPPPL